MDSISVGCQLVPSLLYVDPGKTGLRFTGSISLRHSSGLPGRRTFPFRFLLPATFLPLRRAAGYSDTGPGLRSGAAGIDIETVSRCVSIPIPTASGLLLHAVAALFSNKRQRAVVFQPPATSGTVSFTDPRSADAARPFMAL